MLLALDTSTANASVALVQDQDLLAELTWRVGQRHSVELLQRLDWLLSMSGVAPAEIEAVAVATGPGSFNGVRVALTVAKSLCFALGARLSASSTLDVAAWGYASAVDPVWAVLEAGRGQIYAAAYPSPTTDARGWAPVGGEAGYLLLTPDELASRIDGRALFCGEWRAETRAALAVALGERARFAHPLATRRAAWLAELAQARLLDGDDANPATIEPLYLRAPAITSSVKVPFPPQTQAPREQPAGSEDAPDAIHG